MHSSIAEKIILWVGIILVVVPFFGVPVAWKEFFSIVLGLIVITLSLVRMRTLRHKNHGEEKITEAFVENGRSHTEEEA